MQMVPSEPSGSMTTYDRRFSGYPCFDPQLRTN